MKLTKLRLKQIIQEEISKFDEAYYHPAGATPGAKGEDPKLTAWQQDKRGWAPGGGEAEPEEEDEPAAEVDTGHLTSTLDELSDDLTKLAGDTEDSHPNASEIYEKLAYLLDSYSDVLQKPADLLEQDDQNLKNEIDAALVSIQRWYARAKKALTPGSQLVRGAIGK